ncbi:zf-HC2 domain-containing protein [Streptomyces physcomitrii]|uniref:zf-HC2 domain-containing protein n=1 Tax=Streptomyces physcomitrii TaxID=2724184 RepID=UPI00340635E5
MSGDPGRSGPRPEDAPQGAPRIPGQRYPVENGEESLPQAPAPVTPDSAPRDSAPPDSAPQSSAPPSAQLPPAPRPSAFQDPAPPPHQVLKSLLGAWALAACSPRESLSVEEHLGHCGSCAEEALRLRQAVELLHPAESLDLDPALRRRVLGKAMEGRPARIPVPRWAEAYDAETARLDALLKDFGTAEWHAGVDLRWYRHDAQVRRKTTVGGVLGHLTAVDGVVARALGLPDPLGGDAAAEAGTPRERTEEFWRAAAAPMGRELRGPWRDQSHELVRTLAFAGRGSGLLPVSYGGCALPLRDALVDRAFACWVHAADIAEAVHYPYAPPAPGHLHHMIDLAARLLPTALAARRRDGHGAPARPRGPGSAGRALRMEVEGAGGGEWLIPLDPPPSGPGGAGPAKGTAAPARKVAGPQAPREPAPGRQAAGGEAAEAPPADEVAHIALDGIEFCRLAAGHLPPPEAAAGQHGDREAIREVLFAAAALSRM